MRIFVAALFLMQILGPVKERTTREGNERYREGKFDEALQSYTEAQVDYPEAPELHYNIGNVQYRKGESEKALEEYGASLGGKSEAARRGHFNTGNVHYGAEKWKEAVKSYSDALRIDPGDVDTRQNLELALQKLKEEEDKKEPPPPEGGGGGEAENKEGGEDQTQKNQDPEKDPTPTPRPEESTADEAGATTQQAEMSPEEAERILEALAQMEQAQQMEQQKKQKARARGKGKIW